jgi:hypothetical protein
VLLAGAVAIVAIAAAAVVVIIMTPEPAGQQGEARVRQVDTPFTAAGAVFEIAPTSTAEWAIDVREREPGQGREWLTLAARSRNVTRQSFYPRTLGYRLRTSSGVIIGPQTAVIPPELSDPDGRVRPGQRTSVHLGFQVPDEQTGLSLEFDPGSDNSRIRVPLN